MVHSGPLLRLLDIRPAEGSPPSEGEGRRSAGGDVSAEREVQGAGRDCGTEGERASSAPPPAVCLPATGRQTVYVLYIVYPSIFYYPPIDLCIDPIHLSLRISLSISDLYKSVYMHLSLSFCILPLLGSIVLVSLSIVLSFHGSVRVCPSSHLPTVTHPLPPPSPPLLL